MFFRKKKSGGEMFRLFGDNKEKFCGRGRYKEEHKRKWVCTSRKVIVIGHTMCTKHCRDILLILAHLILTVAFINQELFSPV